MRHAVAGYKLGRDTEHRRAMFRNLAAALFQHGQITTTLPKAKAVQPFVEKLITIARRGDLHARRQVIAALQDRELIHVLKGGADERIEERTLVQKLFEEIAPRYTDRPGGYTRVVKLGSYRKGDGADLVVLQLVGEEEDNPPKVKGRHSRRRQAQNNRTAYAAKLRRAAKGESEPAGEAGGTTTAAEPEQQAAAPESGAEPQGSEEAQQAPEEESEGTSSSEQNSDEQKGE